MNKKLLIMLAGIIIFSFTGCTGSPDEYPPIANAGLDQTVLEGETVTLDGTASHANASDGRITQYEWREGTTILRLSPVFSRDDFSLGIHTITLTVTDDNGLTDTDEVTITVLVNIPPVANAGVDQTVFEGENVILNGSGSADDGTITTYEWEEGGTVLSTAVSYGTTDFSVGEHIITLTVTDEWDANDTDEVNITVLPIGANLPPIADAGENQSVTVWTTVTLDGSGSTDDGTIIDYKWTEGAAVLSTLKSFDKSDFSLGTHTIILTVTDDNNVTDTDEVNITVTAVSPSYISLSKTGQTQSYDLDGNVVTDDSLKDDGLYQYGVDFNFTNNGDGNITDNNTLLIWEQGYEENLTFSEAESYCAVIGARIPNIYEYLSILNYWETSALDGVYFNVPTDGYYWTNTNEAGSSLNYWTINVMNGQVPIAADPNTNENHIRCVKGEELIPPSSERFTKIDTDGSSLADNATIWVVVKDNWTGLLWEKTNSEFFDGWTGTSGAIDYCENLVLAGSSSWYLPSIKQLHSVMDMTKEDSALDTTYFSQRNTPLWTSTTDMFNGLSYVWGVNQANGTNEPYGIHKYGTLYDALCVSWDEP